MPYAVRINRRLPTERASTMSKQQIIKQLQEASALDQRAKQLDRIGDLKRARAVRAIAKDMRDAAYRCM